MGDFWIVLDTTALEHADHQLTSADLHVVLAAKQQGGYRIAIPEGVIQEALNRDSNEVADAWKSLLKDAARLGRRLGVDLKKSLQTAEVEQLVSGRRQDYEAQLRTVADEILPLPDLDTQEVFERAMLRRKPFNSKGKGLQDYVIWTSIVQFLADPNRRAYYVTNNKEDYCDKDLDLHPDLVADLQKIGRDKQALTIVDTAANLVSGPLNASFEFLDQYQGKNLEQALGVESQRSSQQVIQNTISGFETFDEWLPLDQPEAWGDEILGVVRVRIEAIESALKLAGDEMLLGVEFHLEAIADEPTELTRKGWLYNRHLNEYRGSAKLVVDVKNHKCHYAFIQGLQWQGSTEPDMLDMMAIERPDDDSEEE